MAGATQAINFAAGLIVPVLRDSRVRTAKNLRGLVSALATSLFEVSSSFAAVMLDNARLN